MRLCGINDIPGQSTSSASERVQVNAKHILKSISFDIIDCILHDAQMILEALKKGPATDLKGKKIDQGTILQELSHLAVSITKVRAVVSETIKSQTVPSSSVIHLANGKKMTSNECIFELHTTAHKMVTLILPIWNRFPEEDCIISPKPLKNAPHRFISPLIIDSDGPISPNKKLGTPPGFPDRI